MAYPVWPAGLPQTPDRDQWEEAPQPNIISFTPEVGPPISRRRGTARTYLVSGAFFFTDADLATFWSFWEDDLRDGALSFTLAHPVTGTSCQWRFEGQPSAQLEGYNRHRLSFTWRKMP